MQLPVCISIHTPLAGSDRPYTSSPKYSLLFQSTLPLRGATSVLLMRSNFNPHSPCGERPGLSAGAGGTIAISIHTPLAGSDSEMRDENTFANISIHTPLAGSDRRCVAPTRMTCDFNPHSPCGERPRVWGSPRFSVVFQSTLPLRGATMGVRRWFLWRLNFNPHSPCGERRPVASWWHGCS